MNGGNLPNWINKNFYKQLTHTFKCPVLVEKDVVLAGIGEGSTERRLSDQYLYLTWGTGVSGCLVKSQKKHVPTITVLDWASTFKTLENLCSGAQVKKKYGKPLKELNRIEWQQLIDNFVEQLKNVCDTLQVKSTVVGGGVIAQRDDIFKLLISSNNTNINIYRSKLKDNSALIGGYKILKANEQGNYGVISKI